MDKESEKIKIELAKVNIYVDSIYDLVRSNVPYPKAISILIDLLKKEINSDRLKEGVIRALAVKEATGVANSIIFEEYAKLPKEKESIRWALGNTIYSIIRKEDLKKIFSIILDKENGSSRQMFVAALGKIPSSESEEVLIKLLDDELVTPHALEALGKLKSIKALDKIKLLTEHPKTLIRREAKKALQKISKHI